jgi:leader peptidase (prepilin peptidase)/N-methyltransferase
VPRRELLCKLLNYQIQSPNYQIPIYQICAFPKVPDDPFYGLRIISLRVISKREFALNTLDFAGNIYFLASAFFLFGLVFGSFLNVCIYRMPREISVVSPRSACPNCETPIAGYDNIPVLSWILLGGKCRKCKAPISARYAGVELLTGVLFAVSYYSAPAMAHSLQLHWQLDSKPNELVIALKLCVLSFLLIGLIFTDAETKLLPDLLTKPGIGLGLIFSALVPLEGPAHHFLPTVDNWRILSIINSIAGMVLGAAFIWGVALLYEAVRGVEGMGRGDVKLMALIGAFLGVELTLVVLLVGSVIGSIFGVFLILWVWVKRVVRRRRSHTAEAMGVSRSRAWNSAILIYRNFEIPFGVFLGAAALITAFWGMVLVRWYVRISGIGSMR